MQSIKVKGTQKFTKTERFFERLKEAVKMGDLNKYGEMGVEALKEYTPKDTGKTSESWYYEIEHTKDKSVIVWKNSNMVDGVSVAMILVTGHATPRGYWVEGIDYISPAMQPIFDQMAEEAWKEVCKA
jgi:hypothetical protein